MRLIDFQTHPFLPRDLAPGTWTFIQQISEAVKQHGDRLNGPHYATDVLQLCTEGPDFFLPFASVDINTDRDPAGVDPAVHRGYGAPVGQIHLGTDWPAMPKSVKFNAAAIAALGLSEQAQRRIFYENAARILEPALMGE